MPKRRHCVNCEFENPPFAQNYCVNCGNALTHEQRRWPRWPILALVLVIGLVLIAYPTFLILSTPSQQTESLTNQSTTTVTLGSTPTIGDFSLRLPQNSVTVYRTKSVIMQAVLVSSLGLLSEVTMSEIGAPTGVGITFSPNPVPIGTTAVSVIVTADSAAPNGTYPIALIATYLTPQSSQVARQTTLEVTVADFGLQVSPTSVTVQAGSTATLALGLTIQNGFVDPVNITLLNLPQGARYTLASNSTVLAGGSGTTAITLQIMIPVSATAGTYPIIIEAVGGGLVHALTVQLTVTPSTSITQISLAPDFTLPVVGPNGLTGQTVSLSSFRGKVVLLEFMEPWCPHCQNMVPILDSLYSKYGKGNVVFLSVAGPWNGATANDAANFIDKYGTNWTYVYDSSGTIFSEYGVNSTPAFYIIGTDGSVASMFTGEQSYNTLAGAISAAGVI